MTQETETHMPDVIYATNSFINDRGLAILLNVEQSGVDTTEYIRADLVPQQKGCSPGKDCDLTIAYMKGFEDAKDKFMPQPATGDKAALVGLKELVRAAKQLPDDIDGSWKSAVEFYERSIRSSLSSETVPLALALKLKDALEWSGTLIKFHVKPERCVSRGDDMKSAEKIYTANMETLSEFDMWHKAQSASVANNLRGNDV